MEKVIIILLLLSACEKRRTMACEHREREKQVYLTIEAEYDRIDSIRVDEIFVIPYRLMADNDRLGDLKKQLDQNYRFEGNRLIHSYDYDLDGIYSLSATADYLKDLNYVCR